MPDPSSFMVGNAPQGASYAAPLVGFQIGDRLAALPEEYYKAQLRAPVIDPRTGQPTNDSQLVLKALAERGGLQATLSSGLLPFIMGQSSGDELDRAMGGGGSGPSQTSSTVPPATPPPLRPAAFPATGPGHITGDFKEPQSPPVSNETSGSPAPAENSSRDRASFAEVGRLRDEGLRIQRAAERAAAYPQWKERAQVGLAAAQAKFKQADEMESFLREGPRAGAKAAAEWPYAITRTIAERGGQPINVKENEVVTTGAQVNPAVSAATDEAFRRMGLPRPAQPGQTPGAPQGAQPPGRVAELQDAAATETEITIRSLIEEAADIQKRATEAGQHSAAIAALIAKAKLAGRWVERSEQKNSNVNYEIADRPMTEEEWAADRVTEH
jgi:hypothetical protein